MEERQKSNGADSESDSALIESELSTLMSKASKSPVRSIESPKYGLGLTPI
jgi:hypothetical protein